MYPNTPNFRTASDNDAWWLVGYQGADGSQQVSVCFTGGRAFVDLIQMMLGINQDGRWGTGTSNALVNALRAAGASSTLIAGVQADAAARSVGARQLRGAAFLLHQGQSFGGDVPSGIAEGSIAFDPNTVGPQWDTAAPLGPSGDILPTCASRDQAAGGGVTPAPAPAATGTVPQVNVQVPAPEGPATKPGSVPAPYIPSTSIAPAAAPSSSTGLILAGLGVLAAGGIVFAVMRNRGSAKPTTGKRVRRNPATKYDMARGELWGALDNLALYPIPEHGRTLDLFGLVARDARINLQDLKYEYYLGEESDRYDLLMKRMKSQINNASNQQIAAYYEDYTGGPL